MNMDKSLYCIQVRITVHVHQSVCVNALFIFVLACEVVTRTHTLARICFGFACSSTGIFK